MLGSITQTHTVQYEHKLNNDSSVSKSRTDDHNANPTEIHQNHSDDQSRNTLNPDQNSSIEQKQVEQLKNRDLEVRTHERAHLNAAGGIATSGASFSYQTGADGKRYAIGGEVQIDTSSVPGDPLASIKKAETIIRAALAPASPSSQDYQVASQASQMAAEARLELLKQHQETTGTSKQQTRIGSEFDATT